MNEDELNKRLDALHARLKWISDKEERAAWIRGYGAIGEFDQERTKILSDAEDVLDHLIALGGPKFQLK
ncbi:hypothetical protein [Ensifer adhaerens]|uniref:Uncharacterized protein n=1 Tax=Ensifer adhaerens TaxID=106592 RepID=A0A9Q8YGR7_ENSAD|nr:hypothetical protein [Ensifer adhaerens]USJ28607.1 hypothetical protein NE863_35700 [Ensifer adhaerens]